MDHVLWIGGPPGGGKTSIATGLARRHGLRLYSADTRTWIHRDRALDADSADARRFEQLSPNTRWEQPTDDLVAMSLHRERGPMVIDDLAALPATPLIVAEGTPIAPSVVTAGGVSSAHTIWLLPTTAFQNDRLEARGTPDGQARLYRQLRVLIERDAEAKGVSVEVVDGSRSLDDMAAVVEKRFAAIIAAGGSAESVAERQALLREMNGAVVEQIRGFYARPWARGDADLVTREFVCECGATGCLETVTTKVVEAAQHPVHRPGHDPGRA